MKFAIVISFMFGCLLAGAKANNDFLAKCADGFQQFTECLKYKTIKLLDRVIVNEKPIPIAYSFYLTHNQSANVTSNLKMNDEDEFLNDIDSGVDDKLNQVLARKIRMLATTKNLQIRFDAPEQFEGRKKDKNKTPMMMMMGAGAVLLHGAMSKIAFIAGKALIVAKIALAISAVIALKKLFSHDDHHDSTQVIYKQAETAAHTGAGWHRSINNQEQIQAHQMAYSGQVNH